MVKENGMVMIMEEEYMNMIGKCHELEWKLDIAETELTTYRRTMKQLCENNLAKNETKANYGFEMPAGDFSDMLDKMTDEALAIDDFDGIENLEKEDMWFVYAGICSRIPYSCALVNYIIPAIKECYEDYNS